MQRAAELPLSARVVHTPRSRSFIALLLTLAAAGCGPGPGGHATDASELRFEARAEYTTGPKPGGISGGPLAEQLADELRSKLPALELESDGRLAELAARVAVETQSRERPPSLMDLDARTRDVGFVGPPPFVGVFGFADGKWQHLDDYFAAIPNNMRFNRMGVSVLDFGGARAAAIALGSEHLALDRVPRSVPVSGHVTLHGKVEDGYRNPELVWTRPDGSTKRSAPARDGVIDVDSGPLDRGVHRVEILSAGPAGLEVLANFPVAAGVGVPVREEAVEGIDESDPRAAMLELTNAARKRAAIGPLEGDPSLDRVAEAHSRDMVATGFFGHQSPTTGTVEDRLRAAHLRAPLLGENVARAPSAIEAHSMLMASPGHRDNILNPRFSRIGVGVVVDAARSPPALTITEVFAAYPSPIADPAAASAAAVAAIGKRRQDAHLPALERVARLDDAARELATRVVTEPEPNLPVLVPAVIGKRLAGAVHGAPLVLVSYPLTPEDVANDEHVLEARHRRVGVALAQNAEKPPSTVAVVVLSP